MCCCRSRTIPGRAAGRRATSPGYGSTRRRSRSPGDDREGFVGGAYDQLLFDASASTDADGEPLSFLWDLGDGVTRTGEKVQHAYTEPGEYAVRLGVADGTGLSCGEAWDEIKVVGAPARNEARRARSAPAEMRLSLRPEASAVRGGDRDPAAGRGRSHPDPDRAGRAQELGERSAGGHLPAAGRGDQRPLRADLAGAAGPDPQCARRSAAGGRGEDLPAHAWGSPTSRTSWRSRSRSRAPRCRWSWSRTTSPRASRKPALDPLETLRVPGGPDRDLPRARRRPRQRGPPHPADRRLAGDGGPADAADARRGPDLVLGADRSRSAAPHDRDATRSPAPVSSRSSTPRDTRSSVRRGRTSPTTRSWPRRSVCSRRAPG